MDPVEAQHFCAGFVRARTAQQSFRSWARTLSAGTKFSEGGARFDTMRDMSLCEVERLLLLSSSHYRRAHDGFAEVSSAWSYVTLYYGSFFAARALLGLFGVWLTDRKKVLMVQRTNPGQQQFECRSYSSPTGSGSHAQFWELYYGEMTALSAYLSVDDRFAVTSPVADFDWQSQERNRVNYDSFEAIDLANQFRLGFTSTGFPASLPGTLNTQYKYLETVLRVAGNYAHMFGLNTDALDTLCNLPDRRQRVRQLVLIQRPRALGNRAKKKIVCG
jgi:hypothetical protein